MAIKKRTLHNTSNIEPHVKELSPSANDIYYQFKNSISMKDKTE